jgi:hypothetical protein
MGQSPPSDPEEWSDEEWLAWLEEGDAAAEPLPEPTSPKPIGRGVGSKMLYAGMFGLHQAIYGETISPVTIVADADGDPDKPESLEVHLDEEHPDESTVVVRPWLLHQHRPDERPKQ